MAKDYLRALQLISAGNRILLSDGDETKLTQNICQALIEVGGFKLVAVHYAQDNAQKTVIPIAMAGGPMDYLLENRITWGDDERGRGPTGSAIRIGQTCINPDFAKAPEMAPWREAALAAGLRSSVAVPLRHGDWNFGALTVYSGFAQAFTKAETAMLEQLAADLAFGLKTLRDQRDLERSKAETAAHVAIIESIAEAAPGGVILFGPGGGILNFNHRYCEIWRTRPDVIRKMDVQQLSAHLAGRTFEPDLYREAMAAQASRVGRAQRALIALRDGRTLEQTSSPAYAKDGTYVGLAIFVRDATQERRLELRLRRINRLLAVCAVGLLLVLTGLLLRPYFSQANLFSNNGAWPLSPVDRGQRPYSAVALVESKDPVTLAPGGIDTPARGTAFMVSPCYAMTAYHVVFGINRSPDPRASPEALISIGEDGGLFSYRRAAAKVVRAGDFRRDPTQDWVLMQVAGCPGKDPRVGWLPLAYEPPAQFGRPNAATAGFNTAAPPDQLMGQNHCYLARPAAGSFLIHHFCASRSGLSGAPIFMAAAQGPEVVAIGVGEQFPSPTILSIAQSSDRPNVGTYLPEVVARSDIGRLIAEDIARHGVEPDGVASQMTVHHLSVE